MLVVPVSPVPDDINKDVLLEPESVLDGDLDAPVQHCRLVGIYVENGGTDGLGNLGAVEA